ncbi:hypothetical protein EC957_000237 [Mortierella hygrophila]|uniref:Uncharacterized protein n=1 Tax=Mortierella hygrophila TaxID=979708 RepID=A0A9P6K812_9FUNG|nr:hypothetical protein EC957_000237 [Mortierella hygrophila]
MSIPTYSNPCLAPASNTSIYLIGVSDTTQGRLEVNTIDLSNISSPRLTSTIINFNPYQWSNTAPKLCSHYPGYQAPKNALDTQGAIHIQQFGMGWTNDANMYPANGRFDPPSGYEDVAYVNPKFFATVGNAGVSGFVLAMTNTTDYWAGVRSNATDSSSNIYDFDLQVYPNFRPFLAVGVYTSAAKAPAHGNAIVFDTAQSGTIYTATGYDTPDTQVKGRTLILSVPQLVSMKNVVLTNDAIPITSSSGAYILDKAPNSTTAIYYINPSQSTVLQQVAVSGQAPVFITSMVATATSTQIVLYSLQTGGPKFSVFDLATKTWTSSNGISPTGDGSLTPGNGGFYASGSKAPLGAIVGGVIGGLVLLALAILLVIRYCHHRVSLSSPSSIHSKEGNGKTELSSSSSFPNTSTDQEFNKVAFTIGTPHTLLPPPSVKYPLPPCTVTYPVLPRSSIPRDPQLSLTDTYYPPPSPSSQNSTLRRNPQSPMWQSLGFDFIPKTPPGPELHYPENDDNTTIANSSEYQGANSNTTVVFSSFSDASRDISSPVTVVTSGELNSDDYPYKHQRSFTPSSPPMSSSEISYHHQQHQQYTPVGTPRLHHRSQQHLQSPELTYSSPLVSAATHAYSDFSGASLEVDQTFIVSPSAIPASRPPSSHGH